MNMFPLQEYIIKLLEDKLSYLQNCKTKQTYTYQLSRRKRCSMFTPKPPVLQSPAGSLAAYEMNLKILQQQGERPNPDKAVVMDHLMKKTFYMRRQNILKASTSVADLLKTFPCLRSHIQVSCMQKSVFKYITYPNGSIYIILSNIWYIIAHYLSGIMSPSLLTRTWEDFGGVKHVCMWFTNFYSYFALLYNITFCLVESILLTSVNEASVCKGVR